MAGFATSSIGVLGSSTNYIGAYGISQNNVGVRGESPATIGVLGTSSSGYGVYGTSTSGFAGVFVGDVYVTGRFTVASGAKSAAVKKRDGTHARVYCQESPEPWFEDFGKDKLANGKATVKLDNDFADIVQADEYLVFLTEVGDSGACTSRVKARPGFEVRSRVANASGAFHYRVVAKRKDPVGARLEKVILPDSNKGKDTPKPPQHPKPLDPPQPVPAADRG